MLLQRREGAAVERQPDVSLAEVSPRGGAAVIRPWCSRKDAAGRHRDVSGRAGARQDDGCKAGALRGGSRANGPRRFLAGEMGTVGLPLKRQTLICLPLCALLQSLRHALMPQWVVSQSYWTEPRPMERFRAE